MGSSLFRSKALDAGVAVVAFALTLVLLAAGEGDRELDVLGVALAAIASLPLLAWRRNVLAVFAVTTAASAILYGLGYPAGPPPGPTIALFFVGLAPAASLPVTAAVVGGLFAVHVASAGLGAGELPLVPLLFGTLLWGGAWVVGDRIRLRRERIAELEAEAVRDRRLAVAEERTRIARDLHDSAGHALNVILVQAGAARLLAERDPAGARAAVGTIEAVARETVTEIDRLVRVLREDGRAVPGVDPPVSLAALDSLVERHRASGLEVTVRRRGERRPLAPAVDQAAYRIVQEALTNAARHGGSVAEVDFDFGPRSLSFVVTNPAAAAAWSPGHGIAGMRERAELLGGRLEAGAADDTFRVSAELPYRA